MVLRPLSVPALSLGDALRLVSAAVLALTLTACGSTDNAGGGGGTTSDGGSPAVEVVPSTEADSTSEALVAAEVPKADAPGEATVIAAREADKPAPPPLEALTDPDSYEVPTFRRPDAVRGLYVNAWGAGSSKKSNALIALAQRTEVNTLVIDIKDATGFLSHRSAVPLARDIGATGEIRIRDLPGLLRRMSAAGIYPIARIVVTKDPLLGTARPEWAIQDTSGGIWADQKGIHWLNPYEKNVWDYHVAIAREVAQLGFPEVQWDYVRFPDAPPSYMERAAFPGADGRTRAEGIRGFLSYSREALSDLDVHVTADVFGVTTTFTNDVGIGQHWESFIDVVDVALPMVYPSHYFRGSYGYAKPNAYPYEVVRAALEDAVRRSGSVAGAGSIRPWLQDFTLGAPRYETPEVRAQILASYDAGVEEWILWNPGGRYTEEALRPADPGVEWDPEIRLGGELVPGSQRQAFLETKAAEKAAMAQQELEAREKADSERAAREAGAASNPEVLPDTIRRP